MDPQRKKSAKFSNFLLKAIIPRKKARTPKKSLRRLFTRKEKGEIP
jgi:hypothetical protein